MKVLSLLAPAALAAAASLHANDTTPTFPPPLAANADIYTSCANANWPPSAAGGSVLKPQEPDAELQAALAEVSAARIKATIAKLISFGTRHTLSSQTDPKRGIGAARDWIAAELSRYSNASAGRMKVEVPGYVQQPGGRVPFPVLISNVQATLQGSEEPGRVYVTLGHYDTRVSDVMNYEAEQPGANDDASGVAGM
ncbi:hypothetical protein VDGD_20586 [Verticillium dahliae]|nr:hypothetical protein VDGD_20586 [Verticillium dahliae]